MKYIIAGDHSAVQFKERVGAFLKEQQQEVTDVGVFSDNSVDYPDIVLLAHEAFLEKGADRIILICGTGIGVSIAANKIKGIYCALVRDTFTARMAVEHNHVNCFALGARVDYQQPLEEILKEILEAVPQSGRHDQRVAKIVALDN